jgi:hypothetical protein
MTIANRYFFTLINSSYSFYWDITKDWDLTLFSEARNDNEYPFGLRRFRHFTDQQYYMAIAIDFAIRFSWMWKFFPGFSWVGDTEFGLFLLMFLEVARRWMWVFLRAEAEWSKFLRVLTLRLYTNRVPLHFTVRNSRGPAPHDILLGEYNGKLDAD